MKKVVVITIVVLFASQAWALTFMGPPTSDIQQGQFGFGFDYAQSEADIEIEGVSGILTDVEVDTYFARLIFAIADGAELSARLGIDEIEDLGNEFAWGVGVKATLVESASLNWGALFQLTGLYGDETDTVGGFAITGDFDVYEYQVAVGPTLKVDQLSVYGGPFFHFITGDVDIRILGTTLSYDLEQESEFGGYGGLSWQMDDNTSLAVEYQATGDADAIGISLVHRFGKPAEPKKRTVTQRPTPKPKPAVDASGRKIIGWRVDTSRKDAEGNFIRTPVYEDE
jgi:hypothetical protein